MYLMYLFDKRRLLLPMAALLLGTVGSNTVVMAETSDTSAAEHKTYRLESSKGPQRILRVKALLKVQGKLQIKSAEKDKDYRPPVKAKSKLYYDELVLAPHDHARTNRRAVRYYYVAEADVGIDQKSTQSALSESHRKIVHTVGEQRNFFSPKGALQRDELDLLDIPADTLTVHELLPVGDVSIGQTWPQNGHVLRRWLGLDKVGHSDVKSQLISVENERATVRLSGHLTGIARGVETEMDLIAKYHFDFNEKHITRLIFDIQEKRAAGHAEPGFDVLARIQMRIQPISTSTPLADFELAQGNFNSTDNAQLIRFHSTQGGFETLHDHRWHVILDNDKTTMLRLVDDGDLIGQCNLVKLPNTPKSQPSSLSDFQEEIRKALGQNFGEFLEASENDLESGLKTNRVVAAGTVGKLSIRWTYYQLLSPHGMRATCVFTTEAGKEDRFAGADEAIIQTFSFLPEEQSQLTAPTPKTEKPPRAETAQSKSSDRRS